MPVGFAKANLQDPSLSLQANVSSDLVIQSKNSPIDSSADVSIVSDTAILPDIGMDTSDSSCSGDDTDIHVVKDGESISDIAKMFNVSVDTILSANNMKKGDKLVVGDVLLILPCSGVQYTIKKGDSLQSIATHFKVDVNDVASANSIALDAKLSAGDQILIPGATMSDEGGDKPVPNLKKKIQADKDYYASHPSIKNDVGYFINPLSNSCYEGGSCRETQGLHDHYAVDLGAPKGTSIHAAASGTVLLAKTGWNGGYGNLVIISHPNGTETYYAHQSKILTHTGDQVSQGDVIGLTGGKPGDPGAGHSTGPHLHFEVRGAQNPGVDWSWKAWNY